MYWKRIALHIILIITLNLINGLLGQEQSKALVVPLNTMVFWANATVPFNIDTDSYDEDQIDSIARALKEFEFKTCIRFRPIFIVDENVHSLFITNKGGVKRCQYPTQGHGPLDTHELVIGYNCLQKPDIETLLMKAMGFSFEHNRPTRDEYISVLYENIEPSSIELFTKDVSYPTELEMLPYDINSVMHFDVREQSKNGYPSFLIKDKNNGKQQRPSLSPLDIKKFSIVYGDICRKRDQDEQVIKCEKVINKNPNLRHSDISEQSRRTQPQNFTVESIQSELFTNIVPSTVKQNNKDKFIELNHVDTILKQNYKDIIGNEANQGTVKQDYKDTVVIVANQSTVRQDYKDKVVNKITAATKKIPAIKRASKISKPNKTVPVSRSMPDSPAIPVSEDNTIDLIKLLKTSKIPSRYSNSYLWRPLEYSKPFSMIDNISPTFFDRIDQSNSVVETESKLGPQYFESRRSSDVKIALSDANIMFYEGKKWPGNVIKYVIANEKDFKEAVRNRLNKVNNILELKTCVRLEEIWSNATQLPLDYVFFDKSDNYNIGFMGGKQIFGSAELFTGKQHEQHAAMLVMAVLGFPLECSRHDRDNYVKVNTSFILPAKRYHFRKRPASATFSLPYDFRSATHPPWKFWRSKIGTGYSSIATYKRLDPDATIMKSFGQHKELLSKHDIVKINSVYGTNCPLFNN